MCHAKHALILSNHSIPLALSLRYTMQAIIDFAMEVDPTTEIALTVLARPISLAGTEVPFDDFEGLEWSL